MSRLILQVGLVALLGATGSAQSRDAAAVLAGMRKALGGDAALDAVRTLSVTGAVIQSHARAQSRSYALELFVMLPGHFMRVTREATVGGPFPTDLISYRGFRGDELIRWTDPYMPLPVARSPQTLEAAAGREQAAVQVNKREFARLFLGLFGKSPETYPLQFTYAGTELVDSHPAEVLAVTAIDGFVMRLFVDRSTRLPARITWQPQPGVTRRLAFSNFKRRDGLNWPHRFLEFADAQVKEDTRLVTFTTNPKIDARQFDIGK